MANYLKMAKRQQVLALLELGWTYRRIEAETGVRRETVSRYDRARRSNAAKAFPGSDPQERGSGVVTEAAPDAGESNAAKVFPGSGSGGGGPNTLPARSSAASHHDSIVEKLDQGLTVQRIWQDLVEEFGYGASYESIKRYVRKLDRPRRAVGVYHTEPGEEGQVDFFQGAPTWDSERGQWRRPWVFGLTLCHSRHSYQEAAWDQGLPTFLRLHENAFRELGGVPRVVRHDNLRSAVVRACLYDPDSNEVYLAFAKHWGFTPLPTRPRNPKENGKQERSGGYVKDNALKGRRFESLEEQNEHLRHWNRTVARLRIHGTTRRQVWAHFQESEQGALLPLAQGSFPLFESGSRSVHGDAHIEVRGSFYPVPVHLVNEQVRVRFDAHLVRVFHSDTLVACHRRLAPGHWAPRPGGSSLELTSTQKAFQESLLSRCERVGADLRAWAEAALADRGVRALRTIQGVLELVRKHPRERVLHAARTARNHGAFRVRDLKRLTENASGPIERDLITTHESIRPLTDYRLEDLT